MGRKVLRRAGHQATESGSFDQTAVIADIALAGVRVFGDPVARGYVGAVIKARRRNRYGELVESPFREQIFAFVDLLLA